MLSDCFTCLALVHVHLIFGLSYYYYHTIGFNSVHGCPVCTHAYPSHGKMMFIGSRRELHADSPLRDRRCGAYEFISEERRGPARLRTTTLMQDCLRLMKEQDWRHVCGFAGPPMFDKRVGFDYVLDNIPEPMHLFARLFTFFANIIGGGRGKSTRAKSWRDRQMDQKHREECETLGIFPQVWPGRRKSLSDFARSTLLEPTDGDIARMRRPLLERWLRSVGVSSQGLLVGDLRRRVMQIRRQLRQPGEYTFTPLKPAPLPWRLTPAGFKEVDKRVLAMVFPCNTERVIKDGKSFLNYCAATSKSIKKHIMLIRILPTVLRGFVQSVRRALRSLILGWRMLEGQVHSYNECKRLGIEPGARSLNPDVIPTAKKVLVEGVSMTTGAVPPSTIVPCLHLLTHFGDQTALFGILIW